MIDLSRTEALLGGETMRRLKARHVVLFGAGGVGSWCAEALVRTGAGRLTLVDDDKVAASNVNRQCPALAATIGESKVAAMKARLAAIDPEARIDVIEARYERGGIADFLKAHGVEPGAELFIIDAIDSVDCKAELILEATAAGLTIVSSMGAARRLDPTKVELKRFDKVEGDGLARALRQRFKRIGRFPAAKFNCAVSAEIPLEASATSAKPSYMPVTCAFGMALAAACCQSS